MSAENEQLLAENIIASHNLKMALTALPATSRVRQITQAELIAEIEKSIEAKKAERAAGKTPATYARNVNSGDVLADKLFQAAEAVPSIGIDEVLAIFKARAEKALVEKKPKLSDGFVDFTGGDSNGGGVRM